MPATIAAGHPVRAMSAHDRKSAQRAAPDRVLLDIAQYAVHAHITSELAYKPRAIV